MFNGFPLFDMSIDLEDVGDGVSMMSLVDMPASGKAFIRLRNVSDEKVTLHLNAKKKIVTGVALRADCPIERLQEIGGRREHFYFQLSASQVEKIAQKFMKEGLLHRVNVDHDSQVEGAYLWESFIMREELRLNMQEFVDVENGSWMVSYKVDNVQLWGDIVAGKFNGFSPELTGTLRMDVDDEDDFNEALAMMFND